MLGKKFDLAPIAVIILAFFLRLAWPTLVEFKRDEAIVARLALAIAHEGYLPATGVDTSNGTDNLPLNLYLLAIPLRLWPDPLAAVIFTGLLNGLAVLACYEFGRAYFGRNVGLLAAFLFAVSPWAVFYGRKIWCQNLPLVTIGFFAALFAAFVRGKRWALVGAFVGLAALIGLHLGGLAFIPVLGLTLLVFRKEVACGPLLVGAAAFALLMAPYALHDALNGWPNLRDFLRYAGGEARFSWDALRYAFLMMGGDEIAGRMAGALHREYLAGLPNLWPLNGVMMALLALALLYALYGVVRGPAERRRPLFLLLLWFFVPVAMQTRPTAPVHPFYFILLYPVQFLLIAIFVQRVSESANPRSPLAIRRLLFAICYLLLALYALWQLAVIGRVFLFMDQHPTTGGYGIPLKYTRAAAREARRLAEGAEILVLSAETSTTMHETPAVFDALLFGTPRRFADGRTALPVPDAARAVYLVGPLKGDAPEFAATLERLAAMDSTRAASVVALPDGWRYALFRRELPDREDALAGMTRFTEEIHFANRVTWMGRDVPARASRGGVAPVWLAWWVRAAPPPADYHFFAHLVDAQGGLRSQYDQAGFPVAYWRAGDLTLSYFPIPIPADLPAGRYQVWGGLYTYPDVVNVSFLDVAGNPAGERVLLGEIEVD